MHSVLNGALCWTQSSFLKALARPLRCCRLRPAGRERQSASRVRRAFSPSILLTVHLSDCFDSPAAEVAFYAQHESFYLSLPANLTLLDDPFVDADLHRQVRDMAAGVRALADLCKRRLGDALAYMGRSVTRCETVANATSRDGSRRSGR
jgi:hypothetical protein